MTLLYTHARSQVLHRVFTDSWFTFCLQDSLHGFFFGHLADGFADNARARHLGVASFELGEIADGGFVERDRYRDHRVDIISY